MLVLNRKAGESFTINDQITIKILGDFGTVRIGIDAPKHMRIMRDELTERGQQKHKQNFKASELKKIAEKKQCNHDLLD